MLPRFGQLRLNEVSQADVFAWLTTKANLEGLSAGTDNRLYRLLTDMWAHAVRSELPGAEPNPLEGRVWNGALEDVDAGISFRRRPPA